MGGTFPGKGIHTEISPLRFAPVEMTKVSGCFQEFGAMTPVCASLWSR